MSCRGPSIGSTEVGVPEMTAPPVADVVPTRLGPVMLPVLVSVGCPGGTGARSRARSLPALPLRIELEMVTVALVAPPPTIELPYATL